MNNLNPITRLFVLSATIVLFSSTSYSQEGFWADPVAVTDSVTNNTNPNIITIDNAAYLFWEKSSEESSTAIYMRNISNMGEPLAVLEDDNIHYRNPQFINFSIDDNTADTLFYLFYEQEVEGVFSLHYLKYSQDGNFSDTSEAFFTNYSEIKHLRIFDKLLTWETEELILSKELVYEDGIYSFSGLIFIANQSSNPSTGLNAIAFERDMNGQSHIYHATYQESTNFWHTEELFTEGENASVSLVADHMFGNAVILWESYQDEQWQLYKYDFLDDEITTLDIISPNKLHPSGVFFDIPTKETEQYFYPNHLTYVFYENGNNDVFVNELWSSTDFINLSNSTAEDSNPILFHCPTNYIYSSYLLWESNRNNHQQIFMSKIWFIVDTKEQEKNNFSLQTSPNPFHENLQINFSLNKPAHIELCILNEKGQQIAILINGLQNTGTNSLNWKPLLKNGKPLSSGIYFVRLKIDKEIITQKIILQ